MSELTRRDLLRSGLALSASSVVPSAFARVNALLAGYPSAASAEALAALAPREHLLFDFGWKFQFGHGADPARDLGFGNGQGDFAKTGDFEFAKAKFDDSKWRALNLPHDWAVELPFVRDEEQQVARLQAAWPPLSRDQRRLVSARVRDSGERPRPPHLGRIRWRLPRRARLCERLLHRPQRQRLRAVPLRPHRFPGLRRRRTTSWCAWTPALATAGSTRARASIATCG